MAKAIEETLKQCSSCRRKTIHVRNTENTGLIMFLVHIVLTVATAGIWLVLIVIWKILNTKVGGWTCKDCGK
jgi:hypothetical protein